MSDQDAVNERLEYLRGEIHAGVISYGEIAELQDLAEYIDPGDVELLQWAGVEEFPDDTVCPATDGHWLYDNVRKRRIVQCNHCLATFDPVPYEVGPGSIPMHETVGADG